MKYSIIENADGTKVLACDGVPFVKNHVPLATELEFGERIQELQKENNDFREIIATSCDLVNSWCREEGVTECRLPYQRNRLRETIDSLWSKISVCFTRKV